jgi:sulfite reductase (ferredoxin)
MPCYIVQLGGRVGETDTRLAEGQQSVPARNVPAFIVQFLKAFLESLQYPDYAAFLQAGGREKAENLSAAHKHVPAFEEDKNYYYDWGAETVFSLAGRGSGECGAGAFDLIEVDLASAHEALREGRLLEAAVLSAKALLITQGQEARDDAEALELFTKHFLDAGLVDESLRGVVEAARGHAQVGGSQVPFDARADEVHGLVSAVQALYDHMDPSLRFQPVARPPAPQPAAPGQAEARADREADFRGVVCPLNYVKTKLLLEQMDSGQVLSVLLDEPGARNVPQSVKQDGHKILSVKQEGNLWRVLVRRS